jgi:uncharacterized radical SAM protein YgiQ
MPWYEYPALHAVGRTDRRGRTGAFDVVLVSGDAHVDHPAFPAAVVARRLEALGLRVAVIAQPDWRSVDDFRAFGAPRLFFGVTAGAMDSMVANFTSMRLPRREDRLSPGGRAGLRPKRAAQVYAQRLREAYPGVPVVLGGIEASLRRFSHYDFWEDRIRDSILTDSGAALLVFGMAEAVLERVVAWYAGDPPRDAVPRLPQTCVRVPGGAGREIAGEHAVVLPSAEECRREPRRFMELARIVDDSVKAGAPVLVQPHPKGDVVCFPPVAEDFLAEPAVMGRARFNRRAHPLYEEPVPGLVPVQFSVVSHRGCAGACTFCALGAHQGRAIRSKSVADILDEIRTFPGHPDFTGTIPDIGGPSVNMYGWRCAAERCRGGQCTHPVRCPRLAGGLAPLAGLLREAAAVPGVKHVFLGSGLRYDLIGEADWEDFAAIIANHVSGQLKVAPEHVAPPVLALMRKGARGDFPAFVRRFAETAGKLGKKAYLVPYFMTAFPGSAGHDAAIAGLVAKLKLVHEQIQEFTPTPATLATAMYATGLDPDGKPIAVPRKDAERRQGRRQLQGRGKPGRGRRGGG